MTIEYLKCRAKLNFEVNFGMVAKHMVRFYVIGKYRL